MNEQQRTTRRSGLFGPGLPAGHIFGIGIHLDWSLMIIVALIAVNLGLGVLPQWHPDWSAALRWIVAFAAAILLFASVLVHELSHALVGKAQGLKVERITLFMFGGMAHMSGEAPNPKAEFLVAGVGPLTSVIIGFAATAAGLAMGGPALGQAEDPLEAYRALGPVATLLLWLGPINIVLAIFNLIPGFPLDGGRVLRAVLWWMTGSLEKATRWASWGGRGFGWLLMTVGVLMAFGVTVPIFGTGVLGGFWLILIGWFLSTAAHMSYRQLMVRKALEHVPVQRVMFERVDLISPRTDLDALVHEHIMRTEQRCFPVVENDNFLGLVCLDDVRKVPRQAWTDTEARAVMTPVESLSTVSPDADAADAMQQLTEQNFDQIPVVEHGHLRGLVRRQDIMKWLSLRSDAQHS